MQKSLGQILVLMILCLMVITSFGEPYIPIEKWTKSRIYHETFDPGFSDRVKFGEGNMPSILLQHIYSPNKEYWFGVIRPDYTKEGPWNTSIFISTQQNNPVQISLNEHNNYEVKVEWVNEKLLYIRVWWGRIVGTYIVYDVEQRKAIQKETIRDGAILFQQYQNSGA